MSNGDSLGTSLGDENKNVTIGKGNRQQVSETHNAGPVGSHQNVTNVDIHDETSHQFDSRLELLHIRQQVDQTGYRLEDVARRVQQIEIALQLGSPGRSSQAERVFMFLIIAASLLMFIINAYIQVGYR